MGKDRRHGATEKPSLWRMALTGIGDTDGVRSALLFLAWSVFWAAAIWFASAAHKHIGLPDLTNWMLAGWVLGFGLVRWK